MLEFSRVCLCNRPDSSSAHGISYDKWMCGNRLAHLASGGAACPPKPVSLALSKLESHLSLVAVDPFNSASPRGPRLCYLRMPTLLNQRLIHISILNSFRGGGVWGECWQDAQNH